MSLTRAAVAAVVTTAVALSALAVGVGARTTRGPTRRGHLPSRAAQRAALRRAQRSKQLWATVNVCEPARRVVGIRGQMPALGFASRMRMVARFGYYPRPGSRLRRIPAAVLALAVGTHSSGLYQRGAQFTFKAPRPVTIAGSVTFEWFVGHRLLGSTTRAARGGVRNVQDSRPRGLSAARCRIR